VRILKICLVSVEYPPTMGGSGVYAYNLAVNLVKLGHEVHVITRKLLGSKSYEIQEGVKIHRINWIPIPMFYIPFFSILSFKYVLKLHKKEKFDIIHGNWNCDLFYNKKYFGVPLISTMHGTWIGEYNSVLYQPLKYYGINDLSIRAFGKFFGKIDKKVAQKTDRLIVVSKFSKKEVLKYYKIPESKIEVISNGVDRTIFNKEKKDMHLYRIINPNNYPLLLYVGRLVARKAPQVLIDAIAIVRKEVPDIELIIVGAGPLRNSLLKKIHELGLEENIKIYSNISFDTLSKIYAISDIFVLHSYYEAQGIVLLEAMASGLPIVATAVGGVPETALKDICGKLVPPGNPEKLAEAIIELIENEELRKKYGKNGFERVKKYYDWAYLAQKMESLYKEMIKNR